MAKKKTNTVSKELIDSLLEDIQVDESSLRLSDSELDSYGHGEDSDEIPNIELNASDNEPLDLNLNAAPISMDELMQSTNGNKSKPKYELPVEAQVSSEDSLKKENIQFESYKDLIERDAMNPQYERQNLPSEASPSSQNSDAVFAPAEPNEKTQQMSINENTKPASSEPVSQDRFYATGTSSEIEKTIAVGQYANRNSNSEDNVRVTPGTVRSSQKAGQVFTSADASLLQAENLRIAQQRILDLEKEVDQLRQENEELSSAAEIIKLRSDDLLAQLNSIQRSKSESEDYLKNEILILKGNLQYKENELSDSKLKVEELDSRLKLDLKKIRVRERELENRLELARSEKNAIVRSKDETILDLKRKMDQMQNELDNYRQKCLELNKNLESNHEAFKKTTRALRLALANLELSDDVKATLKKAE